MADFCKQCSVEMFGKDFGDLANLCEDKTALPVVICEGCGVVQVDHSGQCVSEDCAENHGAKQ